MYICKKFIMVKKIKSSPKGRDSKLFKDRTGEVHMSNEGHPMTIFECHSADDCGVIFENGYISKNHCYSTIKRGNVKNVYHPSVCGIGYQGEGKYKSKENGVRTGAYTRWVSMIQRCYSKVHEKTQPTYKVVTVCEEWHNFQNFGAWYENNFKLHMIRWDLDKDILFKGNKVYSPETCIFVPKEINNQFVKNNKNRGSLPIGVQIYGKKFKVNINKGDTPAFETIEETFQAYKKIKEKRLSDHADNWRPLIGEKAYCALINYKIEITD